MEADRSDQRPEGGPEDDFVDVEAYAMRGQPVPAARSYRYRVNKQQLVSGKAVLTREEILVSAGKTPVELYRLLIKKPGQSMPVEVKPGEQVNLRGPGVERFIAQHTEVQDGREARRQFALPAEDAAFLDGLGLRWEAVREGEGLWVIIYGLPLPEGYRVQRVSVAIQILPGYPTTPLDMAYFNPPIARADGMPIPNTEIVQHLDGQAWQGWSRHRTGASAWAPGEDGLESHFAYMLSWFARDMAR
ncbi:multiubiquitin domain-containing protein [Roseomonas mucosa]|uniref:multiubiquitin domain-containing protein n=1 Tax=Roseomonas mucosa TaxID=207340 RepID=UPI0022455D6D|nr:multiubiquitin domain-containing protein [Roseomonas mucosa]UZO94602.1 Hypothetical protein RMP42_05893 [Roseomonas mucosa]